MKVLSDVEREIVAETISNELDETDAHREHRQGYEPGKEIKTIKAFDKAFAKGTLLYVKNWRKTAHPIILANMQYRIVKRFIETRQVFIAKKIK